MSQKKVLVIDDEPDIRELLSLTLKRMDVETDIAACFEEGIQAIFENEYCLIITDMRLPDGDGFHIVQYIQKHKPHIPVAVITAFGNVEGAVNTLKAGAFDYVSKPINLNMLKSLVNKALMLYQSPEKTDTSLIGDSPEIDALRSDIKKLARSQAPVFIHGESGVGKELVAHLIHTYGPRSSGPFIAVNCGAVPNELMESEFFGHVKGSFTGAIDDKKGLFEAAEGGTLFLDEVAELPLSMQVKLLRAIQEKSIKRVGETKERPVDARILSASNKDLLEEITEGRFRQELYYRINVIELRVPSLKEHAEDIEPITQNFLSSLSQEHDRELTITQEALNALSNYDFPGNVRELENILERAMTLCNHNCIDISDLSLQKKTTPVTHKKDILDVQPMSLDDTLKSKEKELIIEALEKTKWNRTAAAKLLGISFRTLRYRLKKLEIE